LGDIVLGAVDGCVTAFAVIAGIGAGFSSGVAIGMGFANLIADDFSMAVSNFHHRRGILYDRHGERSRNPEIAGEIWYRNIF